MIVHLECTDLACLNEAVAHDLAQLEGVRRITTYFVVRTGQQA